MEKIKNKILYKTTNISAMLLLAVLFFLTSEARASVAEKKYNSLEEKAKRYEVLIDLKQREKQTLSNQLKMMDLQINSFANDLEITKEKIEQNESELQLLDLSVDQNQKELSEKKSELAEMLRFFYQTEKNISLSFMSKDADVSSVLNKSQYIDQASAKIEKVIKGVQKQQNELEQKQTEVKEKNLELKEHRDAFEEKVEYLENEESTKKKLLQETQGQEVKYKKLLTRVEKQMQELIGDLDALSADVKNDLDKIKKSAPKPSSGLASKKWYYAQDDKKWGYKRIGLSSTLLKDYGCAVTAVAMVLTYHDEDITPGKLSGKPIFARDLIVWPSSWGDVDLNSTTWHGNINWKTVDKSLDKNRPVIVFIRSKTGAGHYVVIHGKDKKDKYVVHDPLFGSNIYLDTSRKLVGRIYNSSTTIDQMIIYK